jgi:hypothetical protein
MLGDQYVGQNVDALVIKFGTFKMNSGDTSYIWQLGNQTNINSDRGSGIASTQFCKVSVIGSKTGIVSQLNTEDSNAGGGTWRRARHVWQHLRKPARNGAAKRTAHRWHLIC